MALNRIGWPHRGYRLLAGLLSAPLLGWLWWRGRREPGYRLRLAERLGFMEPRPENLGCLWIHAASVGEVQVARPLIERLLRHWPAHALLISTQTPTGLEALRSQWGDRIRHRYYPLDTAGATARWLERIQPSLLVLIEREIWPEMLLQCRQRLIPVALVNARLTDKAAQLYARRAGLMAPIWQQLGLVACADGDSAQRFKSLGVPDARLIEAGNLKFDIPAAAQPDTALPAGLAGRRLLVAGSTHEGDERELIAHWPEFARQHPDALLVLVPRHPQRFDAVARSLEQAGLAFLRRSAGPVTVPAETGVLLVDAMGELQQWYAQARVCFIGGTLAEVGGHNPLEAMAWGKPVLFGQHTEHFASLFEAIAQGQGGLRVDSGQTLYASAGRWLSAPEELAERGQAACAFVQAQRGASARVADALQALLGDGALPGRMARVQVTTQQGETLWFDPDCLAVLSPADFEPAGSEGEALATGSGRGQARRLTLQDQDLVLRHYRRGGLMARLSEDRYWRTRPADSRAMREFALLRLLRAWDLPVPRPVAARYQPRGLLSYSADIMVAMIPGTRNVAQLLDQADLAKPAWAELGRAIARLHAAQIFHSDLNCHNLLLDLQGQAWIVDFDKCGLRPGEDWKQDNLARLLRSLRKEAGRRPGFHWREENWEHLLTGYRLQQA